MKLNHLAIIMDGNRRWAITNNLPSYEGHRIGAKNLWNILKNFESSKKVVNAQYQIRAHRPTFFLKKNKPTCLLIRVIVIRLVS